MSWIIPSIFLFTAMLVGLSFVPMAIDDFIREFKDAFCEEE